MLVYERFQLRLVMLADGRNSRSNVATDTLGVPENEARRDAYEREEPRGYGVSSLSRPMDQTSCDTTRNAQLVASRVNYYVRSISDGA